MADCGEWFTFSTDQVEKSEVSDLSSHLNFLSRTHGSTIFCTKGGGGRPMYEKSKRTNKNS